MTDCRRIDGMQGEERAVAHLEAHGFTVLARNVRYRFGEIDIVARERETVVFVEVRSRARSTYGTPLETIDHRKRHRLIRLASAWLGEAGLTDLVACRFDVIGIVGNPKVDRPQLLHIRNAFES
jgi:putative endonuclease